MNLIIKNASCRVHTNYHTSHLYVFQEVCPHRTANGMIVEKLLKYLLKSHRIGVTEKQYLQYIVLVEPVLELV